MTPTLSATGLNKPWIHDVLTLAHKTGNPVHGLTFTPRALGWKASAEKEMTEARDVSVVRQCNPERTAPSACADALALAEAGLVKLGWPRREAERRVEAAWRACAANARQNPPIEPGDLVCEATRLGTR